MASFNLDRLSMNIEGNLCNVPPFNVTGKALVAESNIEAPTDLSFKYPLPVGIVRKKRGKLSDISNSSPKKKVRKKTVKQEEVKKKKNSRINSILSKSIRKEKQKQSMILQKGREMQDRIEKKRKHMKEQNLMIRKINKNKFNRRERNLSESVEKIRPEIKIDHRRSISNGNYTHKIYQAKLHNKIKRNLRRRSSKRSEHSPDNFANEVLKSIKQFIEQQELENSYALQDKHPSTEKFPPSHLQQVSERNLGNIVLKYDIEVDEGGYLQKENLMDVERNIDLVQEDLLSLHEDQHYSDEELVVINDEISENAGLDEIELEETKQENTNQFYNLVETKVTILQSAFRSYSAKLILQKLIEEDFIKNLRKIQDTLIIDHPGNRVQTQDVEKTVQKSSYYPSEQVQLNVKATDEDSSLIEESKVTKDDSMPTSNLEERENPHKTITDRLNPKSTPCQKETDPNTSLIEAIFEEILMYIVKKVMNEELSSQIISLNLEEIIKNQESSPNDTARYIKTDPESVLAYIDEIFQNCEPYLNEINANLRKPLIVNPLNILAKAEDTEIGTAVTPEYVNFPPIISVHIYLNIENIIEETSSRKSLSPNSFQIMIEAEHIHNKMIFDTVNEALQKYRPYGLKGTPMPWLKDNPLVGKSSLALAEVKGEVKANIEHCSYIKAGMIATSELVMTNGEIDEEFLQHIREERVTGMIAEDLLKQDDMWVDYEFEETQVALDVADMVLEQMVTEMICLDL